MKIVAVSSHRNWTELRDHLNWLGFTVKDSKLKFYFQYRGREIHYLYAYDNNGKHIKLQHKEETHKITLKDGSTKNFTQFIWTVSVVDCRTEQVLQSADYGTIYSRFSLMSVDQLKYGLTQTIKSL